jgi:hypothetical protein
VTGSVGFAGMPDVMAARPVIVATFGMLMLAEPLAWGGADAPGAPGAEGAGAGWEGTTGAEALGAALGGWLGSCRFAMRAWRALCGL